MTGVVERIGLFSHFDERERKVLQLVMQERNLTTGSYLFRKGDIARECYFIVSGCVEVGIDQEDGFQRFATLGANEVLGELALLDGGGRSAACRVVEDVELGVLSRSDFDRVFNSGNPFAFHLLDLIAERLIDRLRGAVQSLSSVMDTERSR